MFKDRLKELRIKKEISQRELANFLQLSPSTIAMYETGQREPDSKTMKKIADFFDVSIDYLLGRTDDPNPPEKTIDDEIMEIMRELGPEITLQLYDLKGMTDEEKESLKIFLQGLLARRKMKEQEEK